MTSVKKFLSILLIVMFVSSLCIFTAFSAEEGAVLPGGDDVYVDPGGDIMDDVGGDISDDYYNDPANQNPDDVYSGDDQNNYSDTDADQSSGSGYVNDDSSSIYNNGGYVTSDNYYYFDDEQAAKSGDPNISKVEEKNASLYEVSDVNDAVLKENQWSDIQLDQKKTVTTTGTQNFSSIKENTDKDDNSQWILYIGIVLIGLSALGILYFVVATSVYRKNLAKLSDREMKNDIRRRNAYFDPDEFADIEDYSNRVNHSYSSSSNSRYSSKHARQNTQEIHLPKRYAKH